MIIIILNTKYFSSYSCGITSSLGVILFSIILVVTVVVIIVLRKLWRDTQGDNDIGTTYMYKLLDKHL